MLSLQGKRHDKFMLVRSLTRVSRQLSKGNLGGNDLLKDAVESIKLENYNFAITCLKRLLIIQDGLSTEQRSVVELALNDLDSSRGFNSGAILRIVNCVVNLALAVITYLSNQTPQNYPSI